MRHHSAILDSLAENKQIYLENGRAEWGCTTSPNTPIPVVVVVVVVVVLLLVVLVVLLVVE